MLKKLVVIMLFIGIASVATIVTLPYLVKNGSSQPIQDKPTQEIDKTSLNLPGAAPIAFEHPDFDKDASIWAVVSKSRPLSDIHYVPADLVVPNVPGNDSKSTEERSVRSVIEQPLKEMISAAATNGYNLIVASGYRSYSLQEQYYTNYVRTSGEAEANKFSAKPGHSEHQTGLAVDISLASRECYLEICFGETSAGKWLKENVYTYGFVVRYPADKTEITGYQYEPWHLRYVGNALATALERSNLTLDEALPLFTSAQRVR